MADNDSLLQNFLALKSSGSLLQAGQIFASLLAHQNRPHSSLVQAEIQHFVDAMLEKPSADLTYLKILAYLPDSLLQNFLICIIKLHNKPFQIEDRCALLFSFIKIYPKLIDEYPILELLMETSNTLLSEGKRKFRTYCHKYREIFVTKCFPLLLTSDKTKELLPFYARELREVIWYYNAYLLNACPDEETVVSHPGAAWHNLFQLVNRVCRLHEIHLPRFWNYRSSSISGLIAWWRSFLLWKESEDGIEAKNHVENLDFDLAFMFWSFLVISYSDMKDDSMIPERRPFLIRTGSSDAIEV